MSLTINESFAVGAPPARVFAFLTNPADVVTCLPGAELTEAIDSTTYGGRVKVKVGPITTSYAGRAILTHVDAAAQRVTIVGEGKESGGAGSARMTLNAHVAPHDGGGSQVTVDAVIDIAGRVMQFGRGLIESVNKQLFAQFVQAIQAKLPATVGDDSAPGAGPAAAEGTDSLSGAAASGAATAPAARESALSAAGGAPFAPASGGELHAFPLLWRALLDWLRGLVGGRR